jgi:hypothetical protein
MARERFVWAVVLTLSAMSMVVGCKPSSEEALNDALNGLARTSDGWIEALEIARDALVDDDDETLAMEIALLLRATRATVNGASLCTEQHAEQRIRRVVEDVLDARRHGESTILPVEPLVCLIDPPKLSIETEPAIWEKGEISGYDFDRLDLKGEQMQLYLFITSDEGEELRHIPWPPNSPRVFDATVDLWSIDQDLADSDLYRHLEVWWGGSRLRTIHMIPSNHSGTVPIPSDARLFSFVPREQTGDDADFDGECQIGASAKLMIQPSDATKLVLQLQMHAFELGKGTTEVMGVSDLNDAAFVVFEAESGYQIEEILKPHPADRIDFKDDDHDVDFPHDSSSGDPPLVKQWRFVGDTDGDEAGTRTRMSVKLEDIIVRVAETEP